MAYQITEKWLVGQVIGFCQNSSEQKSHEAESFVASYLVGLQTVFLP
jgi:hypothetical protein